jgi:hypothetical protein
MHSLEGLEAHRNSGRCSYHYEKRTNAGRVTPGGESNAKSIPSSDQGESQIEHTSHKRVVPDPSPQEPPNFAYVFSASKTETEGTFTECGVKITPDAPKTG